MTETTLDNRTLLRKTLVTMGAMVGACVVLVGTLTLVASILVGHAVSPPADDNGGGGALVPAANVHGTVPGAPRPTVVATPPSPPRPL
jgi:hypothetical protein